MSARYLMIMGIPVAIGGIMLAAPIINTFYGAEYAPVIPILRILYLPFAILSIASAATSVILAVNRPSFILKVGLVLVVISISLDLLLIPRYGAEGAAIASSAARLIAPIFYIRFASRECQSSWPIKDTVKITASAIVMGGLIYLVEQFISIPWVSLVVLIPLGAIIHFFGLIFLRVITPEDIDILRHIQGGLPSPIARLYGRILGFMGKMVQKRSIAGKEEM